MTVGLQSILEEVLGSGTHRSNGETEFHCPFCNHYKKKLSINLHTHKYHCWVCNTSGTSIFSLFKKLNASRDQFDRLSSVVDSPSFHVRQETEDDVLSLPKEFMKITEPKKNNPFYRNALRFLLNRGLTKHDLYRYNVGFCMDGPYENRIIIPSYDSNQHLNYFIARTFNNSTLKYKNPEASKNVVVFESQINWDYPLVLVEGMFDAIKVRRNAIPMLGKFPSKALLDAMVLHHVKHVTIMLDPDAMWSVLRLGETLLDMGIKVNIVHMEGTKDAGDMTFQETHSLIENAPELTFSELVKSKLQYTSLQPKGYAWQNV